MNYPTNRDRKAEPRRGKGWCLCDRAFIGNYERCPHCGRRNGRRRLKKTPAP